MIASTPITDHEIRSSICHQFEVEEIAAGRFLVHSPFVFSDGDHFSLAVHQRGPQWFVTDEGGTMMHFAIQNVELTKPRLRRIRDALGQFGAESANGEFRIELVPGRRSVGRAVVDLAQSICHTLAILDVPPKERTARAFVEAVHDLLVEVVPQEQLEIGWHDPDLDADQTYPVDYCVRRGRETWLIFAAATDDRCKNATIVSQHYRGIGHGFRSMAVASKDVSATRFWTQLTNAVDRPFTSLSDKGAIQAFVRDSILQA